MNAFTNGTIVRTSQTQVRQVKDLCVCVNACTPHTILTGDTLL